MSIDKGLIDADHKSLIDLANMVGAVHPSPEMPREITAILASLKDYTVVHFEREERLQTAAHFTYENAHHRRHLGLIRALDAMRAECDIEMHPTVLAAFRDRVGNFLHHWLIDHIVKADILMRPFVAAMSSAAKNVASLDEVLRLSANQVRQEQQSVLGPFGQIEDPKFFTAVKRAFKI